MQALHQKFFHILSLHSTMFLLIRKDDSGKLPDHYTLHSTMFLLIPMKPSWMSTWIWSLHSTMFLLIHVRPDWLCLRCTALHSTMFLLIRWNPTRKTPRTNYFTFHNVSINTKLLCANTCLICIFTFHNVSINTMWNVKWSNKYI